MNICAITALSVGKIISAGLRLGPEPKEIVPAEDPRLEGWVFVKVPDRQDMSQEVAQKIEIEYLSLPREELICRFVFLKIKEKFI